MSYMWYEYNNCGRPGMHMYVGEMYMICICACDLARGLTTLLILTAVMAFKLLYDFGLRGFFFGWYMGLENFG
jgi:hypothetical protein